MPSIDLLQVGTNVHGLQVQILQVIQKLKKLIAIYLVSDATGSIQLHVKGGKQHKVGDFLLVQEGKISARHGLKHIASSKVTKISHTEQNKTKNHLHVLNNNHSDCLTKYGVVCVRLVTNESEEAVGLQFLLCQYTQVTDFGEEEEEQEQDGLKRKLEAGTSKKSKRAKKDEEDKELSEENDIPDYAGNAVESVFGFPCGTAIEANTELETPENTAIKIFSNISNLKHGEDFRMMSNIAPIGIHSTLDDVEDGKQFELFFLAEATSTIERNEEATVCHLTDDEVVWVEYDEARKKVGNDEERNVLFLARRYLQKASEVGVLGPQWKSLSQVFEEDTQESQPSLDINLSKLFQGISQQAENKEPVPVTLLSGFLGSGKTTLMKHILENREGLRVALIVNDMSEINIDSQLIKNGSTLKQVKEKMVELQNGCICCTLREDLLMEIVQLTRDRSFDYLLIESSGISEPLQVAETFTFEDSEKNSLSKYARLDTCVTVVDAYNFAKDYESVESLEDRRWAATKSDERKITDLLIDQLEFADVVILNKMDLVSPEEISRLESIIHHLNPDAVVLKSTFSKVPLKSILDTKLFDFKKAERNAGWLKELRGQHTPETVEYGISSFVFRSNKPFHPQRLHDLLFKNLQDTVMKQVIRSKGFCWMATRMKEIGEWAQSGRVWRILGSGEWLASLPFDEWDLEDEEASTILQKWHPIWGDRRQEIVLIGEKMDKEAVQKELEKCLLTEEEMKAGAESWFEFEDPFEEWETNEDDDTWIE